MPVIDVRGLSKTYEYHRKPPGIGGSIRALFNREKVAVRAVSDISFSVEEGELVGFLGPNGAGKTTTLKMLSGILYPTAGDAKVLGYTPWERNPEYQRRFALVMGQRNQLWWDLPARESFILNKEIYGLSDREYHKTLGEMTDLLDLRDVMDAPVRKLSLGQRMKCELVAALIHEPKVLFLDEPTIGLDVVAQKNIRDFLKRYCRERRVTIVLTSHYMEDIKEMCERVIIIDRSRIVYDGNLVDLIARYAPEKRLTVTFDGDGVAREQVSRFGPVESFTRYRTVLKVGRRDAKDAAAAILSSGLPVSDLLIDEVEVGEVIRRIFDGAVRL
ncbi:MAG: ABC transporter ATP-binding protein [Deltaproteobacteria bacterium]|nr:ABC transporter ATP-binding protein [Deltaproteobacteria bacterium]